MAFLVWGLLACSGVYWLIQLGARPLATPAQALPVSEQSVAHADLTRLLGAPPPVVTEMEPAAESRFKLLGVVAPKSARAATAGEGVALISVDGVARTVRVGAVLDGDLKLLGLNARSAAIGKDGVISMNLQLSAPSAASTGALAPAAPSPVILGGSSNVPPPTVPQNGAPTPPVQIVPGQLPSPTVPLDHRNGPAT